MPPRSTRPRKDVGLRPVSRARIGGHRKRNGADDAPPELDIDHDGGAAALRVTLEDAADDFSIVFVEAPVGRDQEAVLARLAAWSGRDGVPPLAFLDVSSSPSVWRSIRGVAQSHHGGVVVFGVDPHVPTNKRQYELGYISQALAEINSARDVMSNYLRGPLVIVADPHTLTRMSIGLPDFYSWRIFEVAARRVDRKRNAAEPKVTFSIVPTAAHGPRGRAKIFYGVVWYRNGEQFYPTHIDESADKEALRREAEEVLRRLSTQNR